MPSGAKIVENINKGFSNFRIEQSRPHTMAISHIFSIIVNHLS